MIKFFETIIFNSGYAALSFYLIILLALFVYAFFNVKDFFTYVVSVKHIDSKVAMMTLVELIDMGMVAGFSVMMIKGSYNSFVSKTHGFPGENVSSGLLKTKMTTSIVNIVGVSILQRAMTIENESLSSWTVLLKLGFIYILFLISASVLQTIDYFHVKSEQKHIDSEPNKTQLH